VTITKGAASVSATANDVAGGPYTVTATASGARPKSFSLTNTPTADSATLLQHDLANQGTSGGSFGSDGSKVINDTTGYPAYAAISRVGQATSIWPSGSIVTQPKSLTVLPSTLKVFRRKPPWARQGRPIQGASFGIGPDFDPDIA
jgi:hypothetical protein